MASSEQRDFITLVKLLILVFAGGVLLVPVALVTTSLTEGTATIAVSALSSLATLLIVYLTVQSLQQGQESLEELRRERQRNLAIDAIRQVIQPLQEQVLAEFQAENTPVTFWEEHRNEDGKMTAPPLNPETEEGSATYIFLQRECPDLFEAIEKYNERRDKLKEAARAVSGPLRSELNRIWNREIGPHISEQVGSTVRARNLTEEYINDPENAAGLDFVEEFNSQFEVNQREQQELLMTAPDRVVEDEWETLQTAKVEFKRAADDVNEEITLAEAHLRSEYGISEQDI